MSTAAVAASTPAAAAVAASTPAAAADTAAVAASAPAEVADTAAAAATAAAPAASAPAAVAATAAAAPAAAAKKNETKSSGEGFKYHICYVPCCNKIAGNLHIMQTAESMGQACDFLAELVGDELWNRCCPCADPDQYDENEVLKAQCKCISGEVNNEDDGNIWILPLLVPLTKKKAQEIGIGHSAIEYFRDGERYEFAIAQAKAGIARGEILGKIDKKLSVKCPHERT